jgi:hypothetical protein
MPDLKDIQRENNSQAKTQRTTHDRNNDLNRGPRVFLPHNGLDGAGLFRTPVRFLGTDVDGGRNGSARPHQTGPQGQISSSNGRGSHSAQSRLTYTIRDISRTEHPSLKFEIYPGPGQFVFYGDKWIPIAEYVCDFQCSNRGLTEFEVTDKTFRDLGRRIKAGTLANLGAI